MAIMASYNFDVFTNVHSSQVYTTNDYGVKANMTVSIIALNAF